MSRPEKNWVNKANPCHINRKITETSFDLALFKINLLA